MKFVKSFQEYPDDLRDLEVQAIGQRRAIVDGSALAPAGPRVSADGAPAANPGPAAASLASSELPPDTIGLALSGGGIRSATFCLGFLQSLARRGLLRHIDFLSTVSGGGYVGGFLGRFYDRLRGAPQLAPDIVESAVANSASGPVRWLRDHGQFIAPAGKSDLQVEFAIFVRNFLTLHFVLGLLVFALYGLANGFRYGIAERASALLPYVAGMSWSDLPIGRLMQAASLGVFWSPWFMAVELLVLLVALPRGFAYWLASQDEIESYNPPALGVAFLLVLAFLALGVHNGVHLTFLIGAGSILLAFLAAEIAWRQVRDDNAAVGTGGPRVEQLRARTILSRDLGVWLGIIGVLLYFAIVDTAGHAIYEAYARHNASFARALGQLSAGVLALFPFLRGAAQLIGESRSKKTTGGSFLNLLNRQPVAVVLAALLMAPPLIVVSYVSHAAFGGGGAECRGLAVSLFALVLSVILASPKAIAFINRSSLQATYAARIARAFLGASNPNRVTTDCDDVQPGDDADRLTDYRPHAAGGPLHLINVCINQTVDPDTLRTARQRLGIAMALSPLGVSIGKFFHAAWNPHYTSSPITHFAAGIRHDKKNLPLKAVGHLRGTVHPLLGADEEPPDDVELLPLRDWIAISGAAVGTGMGRSTNPALSILFLLANIRIGYWWNSGLTAGDRNARPQVSFVRRLIWILPKLFETQTRLLAEGAGKFRGPWERFWYLSDGGHFENLGVYELIRRRVRLIISVDASAGGYSGFADFQRMVRVDFQAEITPLGLESWTAMVNRDVARHTDPVAKKHKQDVWDAMLTHLSVAPGDSGPLDELFAKPKTKPDEPGFALKKHAALFKVTYPRAKDDQFSLLLYVRASLTGDEPPDVQEYYLEHPTFPQESTANQFFDEAQWESYRRLAEHIGDTLLGPAPPGPPPTTTKRDALWMTQLQ